MPNLPLSPRTIGLPFETWRRGQRPTMRALLERPETPTQTMVQAPTGCGKSTLSAALTKLARGRTVTLTGTKALEDQYIKDFPTSFYDVRGMSNYECLAARDEFVSWFPYQRADRTVMCDAGPCRSGAQCGLREGGCFYFDRVRGALASQAALTNYPYWLSMRRYGRGLGVADTLVCDEAHRLPEELMGAFALDIPMHLDSARQGREYDPKDIEAGVAWWRGWAATAIDTLKHKLGYVDGAGSHRKSQLLDTLDKLAQIDATWAWDRRGDRWTFEPTVPSALLDALATDATVTHRVYLSATVTLKTLSMLGIESDRVKALYLPSLFPLERRPVYLVDAPRVDYHISDTNKSYWVSLMDRIIRKRLDRKGLIHSVSYKRALEIKDRSKHGGIMLAPQSSSELTRALAVFATAPSPMILVSPNLTTGLSFAHDAARYQILAKCPLPDTQSCIARARMAATARYRDHLASTSLVQAIGRIVRDEADWGETFIVDGHAQAWFLRTVRDFIPEYVWDAFQFDVRLLPAPLEFS